MSETIAYRGPTLQVFDLLGTTSKHSIQDTVPLVLVTPEGYRGIQCVANAKEGDAYTLLRFVQGDISVQVSLGQLKGYLKQRQVPCNVPMVMEHHAADGIQVHGVTATVMILKNRHLLAVGLVSSACEPPKPGTASTIH